jgi:hypothetical protein
MLHIASRRWGRAPALSGIHGAKRYPILTIDNDKESVADEAIAFFRGTADAAARRPGDPVPSDGPKHLLVA